MSKNIFAVFDIRVNYFTKKIYISVLEKSVRKPIFLLTEGLADSYILQQSNQWHHYDPATQMANHLQDAVGHHSSILLLSITEGWHFDTRHPLRNGAYDLEGWWTVGAEGVANETTEYY